MLQVLWFDDEHHKLHAIFEEALDHGIKLIGVTNATEGIQLLRSHPEIYDAVLVDGVFHTHQHLQDTLSESAFGKVARFLVENRNKHNLNWYILSGQPTFQTGNAWVSTFGDKRVYDKANKTDRTVMFETILTENSDKALVKIRFQHSSVLDACNALRFSFSDQRILLELLNPNEGETGILSIEQKLNSARKFLEAFFRVSNRLGFIDDLCIPNGQVSMLWSMRYLGKQDLTIPIQGLKQQILFKAPNMPLELYGFLNHLLRISQAASHTDTTSEEAQQLRVTEYLQAIPQTYLLSIVSSTLCEAILWLHQHAEKYPDAAYNRTCWERIPVNDSRLDECADCEWIEGTVLSIASNGYGTFKRSDNGKNLSIIPQFVNEHKLVPDQTIRVIAQLVENTAKGPQLHIQKIDTLRP